MQLLDITNLHWCQIGYNVYNVYIPVVLTPLVWLMKRRLLNLFRETLNSGSAGFWRNVSTRFIGNKLKVTLKIGLLRGKIEIWFLNEMLEVTARKPENVRNCQEMAQNVRKCQEMSEMSPTLFQTRAATARFCMARREHNESRNIRLDFSKNGKIKQMQNRKKARKCHKLLSCWAELLSVELNFDWTK